MSSEIRKRKLENKTSNSTADKVKSSTTNEKATESDNNESGGSSCCYLLFCLLIIFLSISLLSTTFLPSVIQQIKEKTNNYDQRTKDVQANMKVTLEDIYFGSTIEFQKNRNIICPVCSGSGIRSDADIKHCDDCNGNGFVTRLQQMGHMKFEHRIECPKCKGAGVKIKASDKCKKCKGKGMYHEKQTLELSIPKGIEENGYVILNEKADEYPNALTGDLYIFLSSEKHGFFTRKNDIDLECVVEISLLESLIGFKRKIRFLTDELLVIRKNDITSHGEIMEFKGKGMPLKDNPTEYGDLFVSFHVTFPQHFSMEELSIINNLFENQEWNM